MLNWNSPYWPEMREVAFAAWLFSNAVARHREHNDVEIAVKCALSEVWAYGRMYEAKKLTPRDLAKIMRGEEEHTAQRLEG